MCTESLHSSTKFNHHTLYHFWVQMAVGPPQEDIYGHIQYPFHSESPGCDHCGLHFRDVGRTERRPLCDSALLTRGMQRGQEVSTGRSSPSNVTQKVKVQKLQEVAFSSSYRRSQQLRTCPCCRDRKQIFHNLPETNFHSFCTHSNRAKIRMETSDLSLFI